MPKPTVPPDVNRFLKMLIERLEKRIRRTDQQRVLEPASNRRTQEETHDKTKQEKQNKRWKD